MATQPVWSEPGRPAVTVQFRRWRSLDRNGRLFARFIDRPGVIWDVLDGEQTVSRWGLRLWSVPVSHAEYRGTLDAMRQSYVVTVRL